VLKVEKNKKSNFGLYCFLLLLFAVVSFLGGGILALYLGNALPDFESIDVSPEGLLTIVQDAMALEDFWLYVGGVFGFFALLVFLSATRDYNNTPRTLTNKNYDVDSDKKGSARWLSDKEINKYFPRCAYDEVGKHRINGFVIQTVDSGSRTFANYKDGVHCLIIGTTGSGKTIRFVIPTMQFLARSALRPSIVVTDPKGELYFSQSKLYQERGYEVLTLNLREPLKRSSCWNPCNIAYKEYQEGLKQKELIKFHSDNVDEYKGKLKLAESKGLFHEQWYEFNGYAFANLKSAMTEAERREG
jgi:type IV secretion system protein VirD4